MVWIDSCFGFKVMVEGVRGKSGLGLRSCGFRLWVEGCLVFRV